MKTLLRCHSGFFFVCLPSELSSSSTSSSTFSSLFGSGSMIVVLYLYTFPQARHLGWSLSQTSVFKWTLKTFTLENMCLSFSRPTRRKYWICGLSCVLHDEWYRMEKDKSMLLVPQSSSWWITYTNDSVKHITGVVICVVWQSPLLDFVPWTSGFSQSQVQWALITGNRSGHHESSSRHVWNTVFGSKLSEIRVETQISTNSFWELLSHTMNFQ